MIKLKFQHLLKQNLRNEFQKQAIMENQTFIELQILNLKTIQYIKD